MLIHLYLYIYMHKLDMCLWNMDAPGSNKNKTNHPISSNSHPSNYGKNLQVLYFDHAPSPRACDVSEVWATLRWTNSPRLVTVWPPKLQILHFVYKRDGIMDGRTDNPNTRCPLDLSGRGNNINESILAHAAQQIIQHKFMMFFTCSSCIFTTAPIQKCLFT